MSRDQIHDKIDELLGLLSINNSRLSLHTERLSQLDIDVLRKQCIELYDEINRLALKSGTKPSLVDGGKTKPVQTPVTEEKEVVKAVEKPQEQENVVKAPEPPSETPKKEVKPFVAKSKKQAEEEMLSLFEKFNSKPIDSIAKAISIAKRFEFQSNFFEGEAKDYKEFMSRIDEAGDREEAFSIYHEYKNKLNWDNEELKDELKALMYRKYH
jgi:hypothetical protein